MATLGIKGLSCRFLALLFTSSTTDSGTMNCKDAHMMYV